MPDIIPALTVTNNPWFVCALLLTVRVMGVGAAWSWTLIPATGANRLQYAALTGLVGLLLNVLPAMVLAEAGVYTQATEWIVLSLIALAGAIRGRARLLPHLRDLLPGIATTFAIAAVVMLLPHRGEWIAGGWDPGIYVGQAVSVSHGGDFTPAPDPLLSSLTAEELQAFTRQVHNYTEYLPVVPVSPETRSIQHFFFRLTPSWISVLFRCGDLRAATRVNLFTGALAVVLMLALLDRWKRGRVHIAVALLLMLSHPVWTFMLNFPTSEMLQLVLVLGLFSLHSHSDSRSAHSVWIPLALFAALVNRFSFIPFAGLLLCAWGWARPDSRFATRLLAVAACVLALLYDYVFCSVTLGRLDELVAPLVLAGSVFMLLSLCIRGTWPTRFKPHTLAILFALAVTALLGADRVAGDTHLDFVDNLREVLPFLNPLLVLAALGGSIVVFRRKADREFQGTLLFLAACSLVLLAMAAIASLYPWALRRHLVFALPLLAWLAGALAQWAWDRSHALPSRIALVACVLTLVGFGAPRAMHAMARTEFNGLSAILGRAAAQLEPTDIVVADHFRWGTPLKLIHGIDVLNGEVLWQDASPERSRIALGALTRLRAEGRRIVLFTSTAEGPSVFPLDWGPLDAFWSSGPVTITDLNHRAGATDFHARPRPKVFTLYVWAAP